MWKTALGDAHIPIKKMFPNIGIKLSLQSKLKKGCKLRLFSDLTLFMWSMLKFYLFHIVSPVVTSTLSALGSSFWQSTAAAEQFEGFSSPSRGVKSGFRGILRRNTKSFSPLFHVNHFSQADFFFRWRRCHSTEHLQHGFISAGPSHVTHSWEESCMASHFNICWLNRTPWN